MAKFVISRGKTYWNSIQASSSQGKLGKGEENLRKVRENQGKTGKVRELFPWFGEIFVFQIVFRNFSISRNALILYLFVLAENLKDCTWGLKGYFYSTFLLEYIWNVMVSLVLLQYFDEIISKIAKKPLNVLLLYW